MKQSPTLADKLVAFPSSLKNKASSLTTMLIKELTLTSQQPKPPQPHKNSEPLLALVSKLRNLHGEGREKWKMEEKL
ncbi:hypothetical protein HKD37_04G010945 [Glycine soja]|nr:hypothetical protein GmHk_04G011055 [Glycine max]